MIARSPIRKVRSKARPARLKGNALAALRAQCFERDGYLCQHILKVVRVAPEWVEVKRCRKRVTWGTGHMAHIVSRGRGGKDELSNVTTKCAACHIGIEHSYGPSGQKPCPRKVSNV